MDRAQNLIKKYFKGNLGWDNLEKSPKCPDENLLIEYLSGDLDQEKCKLLEHHLAGCGFCLNQLSLASEVDSIIDQKSFLAPQNMVHKVKSRLGINQSRDNQNKFKIKIGKELFFLTGTLFCFALSFVFSRYFMQFLVATLVLGIRWAFESKGGNALITVLDSWRQNSQTNKESSNSRKKPF